MNSPSSPKLPSLREALMFSTEFSDTLPPIDRRRSFLYATDAHFNSHSPRPLPQVLEMTTRDISLLARSSTPFSCTPIPTQTDSFNRSTVDRPRRMSLLDLDPFALSFNTKQNVAPSYPRFDPFDIGSPVAPRSPDSFSSVGSPREQPYDYAGSVSFPSPIDPSLSSKAGKSRPTFSRQQVRYLEKLLERSIYPSQMEVEEASRQTGMVSFYF